MKCKLAAIAAIGVAGIGLAQERHEVRIEARTFDFISAEAHMPGKTVAGAPYSGDSVTETVQILADGTRISRKSSSKTYRDSQGRTRDERTIDALGPWASSTGAMRLITISDPVAKEVYTLNEKEKTATKMKMPEAGHGMRKEDHFNLAVPPPHGAGIVTNHVVMVHSPDNSKEESLGKQTLEGLEVEGKRNTSTIPANQIGNDRPLATTIETWTSTALGVRVRSITKDPQFGETDYRLTNVSRAEPAKSLFQIPADYTVQEGGPIMIRTRTEKK